MQHYSAPFYVPPGGATVPNGWGCPRSPAWKTFDSAPPEANSSSPRITPAFRALQNGGAFPPPRDSAAQEVNEIVRVLDEADNHRIFWKLGCYVGRVRLHELLRAAVSAYTVMEAAGPVRNSPGGILLKLAKKGKKSFVFKKKNYIFFFKK